MKIEIYGAKWCTVCDHAVKLCESKNLEYDYFDIDDTENLVKLETKLNTRARSIPQIFLNGNHLKAGFTELQRDLSNI
jgi:glutaredoxin